MSEKENGMLLGEMKSDIKTLFNQLELIRQDNHSEHQEIKAEILKTINSINSLMQWRAKIVGISTGVSAVISAIIGLIIKLWR